MLFEFVLGLIAIGSLLYISQQVEVKHDLPGLEVDMSTSPIDIQDLVSDIINGIRAFKIHRNTTSHQSNLK